MRIQPEVVEVTRQEQTRVWQALNRLQRPQLLRHACRDYLEGDAILGIPSNRIPTLEELNREITPRTGWKTSRTSVRYSDSVPWYRHFARREFLVTDYMRSWDELEFTPEPDMFHDIVGHLPFLVLPRYTALEDMFAAAFPLADSQQREDIKRLAWFSTEFGLMREGGELKAFGAGLLSSVSELSSVMSGRVPIEPFSLENVLRRDKAIWSHNQVLFSFDSIDALRRELERYFQPLASSPAPGA